MPIRSTAACVLLILFVCGSATAAQLIEATAPPGTDDNPPAPLEAAAVGRERSRIKLFVDGETTVIDITSRFGIDKAVIRRKAADWPRTIRVRLHLKGLEHFSVGDGERSLNWSVASGGEPLSTASLRSGDEETVLDADSPFYTTVRMVGGHATIPLKRGYFEVPLPSKLLEKNPKQIQLKWVDFYR